MLLFIFWEKVVLSNQLDSHTIIFVYKINQQFYFSKAMLVVLLLALIVSSVIATSFISENGFNLFSNEDNLGRNTNCYYGLSSKRDQVQENYFCSSSKVKYCNACNQRVPLSIKHYKKQALLLLEMIGKDTITFNAIKILSKFLEAPETEKMHNVETWSKIEPYKLINARHNSKFH